MQETKIALSQFIKARKDAPKMLDFVDEILDQMPIMDRRELSGRFTSLENDQRLTNYPYFEIQMMEMIGGWCHVMPPINCKAVFGYHTNDHAQAADRLNERTVDLRSSRNRQEAANDEIAYLCEYIWNLTSTIEQAVFAPLIYCLKTKS